MRGNRRGSGAVNDRAGLSPRVRGNLQVPEGVVDAFRSIPARAGEPTRPFTTSMVRRVYPRACGGTWVVGAVLKMGGSIPARAGEPTRATVRWLRRRVYPRACGGTFQTRPAPGTRWVYPRACGGTHGWTRPIGWGSIPARAGEPSRYGLTFRMPKVYPRACGGTRRPRRRQPAPQGSIPARAGEPQG